MKTAGRTGTPSSSDVPKSPWTKFEIQSQYCVRIGWSVPSLWFSACDRRLRRERPEDVPPDVARQQLGREEHDHAQQQQRDERETEALEEESGDG